ncbi:MAG: hypothetical protein R3313_04660, partial [Candidatus Saccharimonadales bacterium]|nr:hypothetical protein [Candidatus Saccharimonadales bacterium]
DVIFCSFLNVEKGDIKVTKFHDINENGYWDKDEPTLAGWDMHLDMYRMHLCHLPPIIGGPVAERSVISDEICDDSLTLGLDGRLWDEEPDRTLTQTTNEDGMTTFENLPPSPFAYYELSETLQEGFQQTNIYCRYDIGFPGIPQTDAQVGVQPMPMPMPYPGDNKYPVMLIPGVDVECFVGNTYEPVLTIEKFNDQPEPTVTGETVEYTILVTVPEESGCVYREGRHYFPVFTEDFDNGKPMFKMSCETEEEEPDDFAFVQKFDDCIECEPNGEGMEVTVTDLPPEGFLYQSGSWTANSNVRGDLKAAGITGEPGYLSPGQWTLTSPSSPFLVPGEVITLTYNTVIDEAVTNGVYPDTAFVEGFTSTGDRIFGNLHFTDTPFVGTQVEVLEQDPVTGGFVLGVLSETGNPAILAPIAGVLISAGAVLTGTRRKERRWLKKLGASLGGAFAALALTVVFATSVMAAGFWTTNISTPRAFTQTDTINIDYQVSATTEAANDTFEVTLYQNGVNIGDEIVNTPYGDSGRFTVTLAEEGDYTFKTEVENLTQGGSQMSDEVSVQYDATAPGAPEFGTTERDGNKYTVSFTAPSGDVEKVNVYASTEKSFDLDENTLVGEVTVTPGEESSFEYTAPDADKRYFAVVAVDDAGNQSSAVGDSEVQVTGAAGGAVAAALDSDGDGVPDVDDPAPFDPEITGQEDDSDGEIAGTTTDSQEDTEDGEDDDNNTVAWFVVAVVVAGGIGYYFYSTRGEKEAL